MLEAADAGDYEDADLRHADELNRMKARLWGLVAAIMGDDGGDGGAIQLAHDIAYQMDDCAEAFDDMRQRRKRRKEAA